MLELAIRILSGTFLSVVLSIIAYELFIVVRYHEVFKFSLKNHGLFLPLLPFVGNVYVALFSKGKASILSIFLWAEKHCGMPMNLWFGHKYHYVTTNAEEARIILNHPKCCNKAEWYDDLHQLLENSILTAPMTAAGMDIESSNPDIEKFGELIDSAQDELVKVFFNPLIPVSIWLRTPLGAKFKSIIQDVENMMNTLMMEKQKFCVETSEYVDSPTDIHLIDLLLSESYKKTCESITFELIFLAAAATDTNGHTLAFCFTLLGMHPDEQQRVYEEVVTSVGDSTIDSGNIHHLKYTEAVICESLRLFAPVPVYGRRCDEDIDLGTKVIPKGANFVVDAFHIHRSPEYWEDPLKYDPTRFLPENASKIIPGSYLPFSIGARNCIGNGMAMTLLKITVASVVRAYRITSSYKSLDDFKLESCISMKTSHNLDCKFIPRS